MKETNKKKNKKIVITINIDEYLLKALDEEAFKDDRKRSGQLSYILNLRYNKKASS